MALQRVQRRECLNVSSDSPFVKASKVQPLNLDASPFVFKRSVGYVGNPPSILGTPSFPTPLDDVRVGHNHSHADVPDFARRECPTTPKSHLKILGLPQSQENGSKTTTSNPLRTPRRRILDSCSSPVKAGSPSPLLHRESQSSKSFWERSALRNIQPASILNPNKAVLTLDASGKILTVNDMSTLLLGEDLTRDGSSFFDIFSNPADVSRVRENLNHAPGGGSRKAAALDAAPSAVPSEEKRERDNLAEVAAESDVLESEMVVFSGNVVTLKTDDMGEVPASLWMKPLPVEFEEGSRWIAVLEPITITTSRVIVNLEGEFVKRDKNFGAIFGTETVMDNESISTFLPFIKPDGGKLKECVDLPCTGCTKEGETFPLSLTVSARKESAEFKFEGMSNTSLFDLKIKLFSNISGLVVVDENGIIKQYNHNFTRLLFGYGSKELENQRIDWILPEFRKVSCQNRIRNFFQADSAKEDNAMVSKAGHGVIENMTAVKESPSIPFMDDSLKENQESESRNENAASGANSTGDCFKSSNYGVGDRNSNMEGSSIGSPNKAFIVSDSQFTMSSSNLGNSKSLTQKSFSQANTRSGMESPPVNTSPVHNGNVTPNHIMRDITNSMNVLNFSEQPDQSRYSGNFSLLTSTPAVKSSNDLDIQEGSYFSIGRHKDGSCLSVLYQIRRLSLNGRDQFCLWITWEPNDSSAEETKQRLDATSSGSPTRGDSLGTTIGKDSSRKRSDEKSICSPLTLEKVSPQSKKSLHHSIMSLSNDSEDETSRSVTRTDGSSANEYSLSQSLPTEVKPRSFSENDLLGRGKDTKDVNGSNYEEPEWILTNGEYNDHYTIMRQIGKGAFGYVKMSHRNSDGLIVITKFIKKSQVYRDSWTVNPKSGKRVCLEIDLLLKLDHPNIVRAFEYFENDKYFQLVMEKWGSGMDLFEFIDRNPALDEPLTSYIFRQIVSALVYLRSLNIIHRDIKDENIIINQKFHVKLIDFGSATYLEDNKTFPQFAGTIEYCSPEVLKGCKYSGPELEIWSLGVTLYTLVFGENPFSTVDQVLKESLVLPITYSDDLFALFDGMLNKCPFERMKLEEVAAHKWTNQPIDLEYYSFEDIVTCDNDELSPFQYIGDYGFSEESFSTSSSSFIYEDRQSRSATESSFCRSQKSFSALMANTNVDEVSEDGGTSRDVKESNTTHSSRTTSSQSSVTIDSSVFFTSPPNKLRQKTCSSSFSDCTEASITAVSSSSGTPSSGSRNSTHCRSTNKSSETPRSSLSRSSSLSNVSSCSSFPADSSVDSDTSTSCSEDGTSSSTSSSSSSSSLASQETVSIYSSSDEDTLANTYTNVLALEHDKNEN